MPASDPPPSSRMPSLTRGGLTFEHCAAVALSRPDFIVEAVRLMRKAGLSLYSPPTSPLERLIDENAYTPEQKRERVDHLAGAVYAFVFLTVWQRLPPNDDEDTSVFDHLAEQYFRERYPEMFPDAAR